MATLRDDLADLPARLERAEARADLPHREKYLLLVTGFLASSSTCTSSSPMTWSGSSGPATRPAQPKNASARA